MATIRARRVTVGLGPPGGEPAGPRVWIRVRRAKSFVYRHDSEIIGPGDGVTQTQAGVSAAESGVGVEAAEWTSTGARLLGSLQLITE